MTAKVITMDGKDITPAPPSIEEDLIWTIVNHLNGGTDVRDLTQLLQSEYKIERI